MASRISDWLALKLGIVGFLAGGLIGFLYRPSALIIGQLPFSTVITRGANLKGVEQMLIPMAQTSFNNMMVAAVIGAAIGIVIGLLFSRK
ncbi:MAG: hypothetical protein WBK44_03860 [Smithellaceae bacterium]|jgi:hypothetical protein|nr:hypothetical protein [Syntrophaceae bacterium]MDX9817002.1 hypothetical protein [Smithellaceae bacterium]NMD05629.1 hypothetical protein [Deltaproteobacteria bacterium]MBP8609089.1 hypothetical protein [Syntrophaceae bacterium]HNT90928.1 hypothetical protein [Smithellaceae bacterium]